MDNTGVTLLRKHYHHSANKVEQSRVQSVFGRVTAGENRVPLQLFNASQLHFLISVLSVIRNVDIA
jgi:hypothetical protein